MSREIRHKSDTWQLISVNVSAESSANVEQIAERLVHLASALLPMILVLQEVVIVGFVSPLSPCQIECVEYKNRRACGDIGDDHEPGSADVGAAQRSPELIRSDGICDQPCRCASRLAL